MDLWQREAEPRRETAADAEPEGPEPAGADRPPAAGDPRSAGGRQAARLGAEIEERVTALSQGRRSSGAEARGFLLDLRGGGDQRRRGESSCSPSSSSSDIQKG